MFSHCDIDIFSGLFNNFEVNTFYFFLILLSHEKNSRVKKKRYKKISILYLFVFRYSYIKWITYYDVAEDIQIYQYNV